MKALKYTVYFLCMVILTNFIYCTVQMFTKLKKTYTNIYIQQGYIYVYIYIYIWECLHIIIKQKYCYTFSLASDC